MGDRGEDLLEKGVEQSCRGHDRGSPCSNQLANPLVGLSTGCARVRITKDQNYENWGFWRCRPFIWCAD